MSRNPVFRIVFYSVCILLLVIALISGIGFDLFRFRGGSHSENLGNGTADAEQIRGIEIDWAAGEITILPSSDATEIRFYETASYSNIDNMVWEVEDGTLSIDFCEDSLQFGYTINYSKDLIIEVPENWLCRNLEIDAASAEVRIHDMSIDKFDFDGASGECILENCTVNIMDVDAASGDVTFSGSLNEFEFDGASANCTLVLKNSPNSINMDGMSGHLDVTLPSDCGFLLTLNGLSRHFHSEFETTSTQDNQYRHGDGACHISLSSMSGNATIRKGDSPAQ